MKALKSEEVFVKSRTNLGDLSKTYFFYMSFKNNVESTTLITKVIILTKDLTHYSNFKILKTINDCYLIVRMFGVKVMTLESGLNKLNELMEEKNHK